MKSWCGKKLYFVHVMDILPTCLELAGAEYPKEYNGHKITPVDGLSLTPILKGNSAKGMTGFSLNMLEGKL